MLLFWNSGPELRLFTSTLARYPRRVCGCSHSCIITRAGWRDRPRSPWPLFCCCFSSSSGRSRPPAGSGSRLTSRLPGSRASSPTVATGPPWPRCRPTARWWASLFPTYSRSATGRPEPAPGFPTCTWPAWRSRSRTWRYPNRLRNIFSKTLRRFFKRLKFHVNVHLLRYKINGTTSHDLTVWLSSFKRAWTVRQQFLGGADNEASVKGIWTVIQQFLGGMDSETDVFRRYGPRSDGGLGSQTVTHQFSVKNKLQYKYFTKLFETKIFYFL